MLITELLDQYKKFCNVALSFAAATKLNKSIRYNIIEILLLFMVIPNIVLNKSKKKKKEVVTKAENNYLSSECPSSTTSYGKISIIRANNLASAQRKNQVHHKKIGGR